MSFNNHVMQLEKTSGHAVLHWPGLMETSQGEMQLGPEGEGAATALG